MRLANLFTVKRPIDEVWRALLDTAGGSGEERSGVFTVKVGGVAAEYHGSLRLKEVDESGRRIVAYAAGVEARDQSAASATITATVAPAADGTTVSLDTDLAVGGRLSPFGSGVVADVASTLVKRFAATLEKEMRGARPQAAPAAEAVRPEPPEAVTVTAPSPSLSLAPSSYWLPVGLVGVLAAMAVMPDRRARWALAAVGAGLVVVAQRSSRT